MIPQSQTERLLEEQLARQGVTIERETEATALEAREQGATVRISKPDGAREIVDTDWLIGCDGAHSIVRRALEISFEGETDPSDWMLADVHTTGYPRPDTHMSIYWHRDGVLIILPIEPGRYRLIVDVPHSPADQPRTLSLDEMQALVDQRGPAGLRLFDPVWLSGFRINERKIKEYRRGRVFLAGDAAHIHSPAGGQGMNTGMQDAFNLAWKLALVRRGACDDRLLDTYSEERSHVGDVVLKNASRLTAYATIRNPVLQAMRNMAGHALLSLSPLQHALAEQMSETKIGYPTSPLNGVAGAGGLKPGDRFPPRTGEPPAGAGDAPLFALHAALGSESAALISRHAGLIVPEVRRPIDGAAFGLVRPDGYLSTAGDDPAAVAELIGRLHPGDG